MARIGLSRMDVKRARDALLAHTSIDAIPIAIALGNTGSKTTIHRYLKELEDEGAPLTRAGSLSDAIQDLMARLAVRLHEEAQVPADQQATAAAARRQQAQSELAKLAAELATTRFARDKQAHGEALQSALNRALTDRARAEAERDAASRQPMRAAELLQVREPRDSLRADLTKLAAQLGAQQQLLVDDRMRLGGADAAG
ncbi:MAG: Tn4651 auxiliary cointegrate resolution protein T [uncultured Caballeronia sp.]|nr:MAG: Tn4651 auxiliary cointegrate resolution protein T [uncultured Caballeronia sp.]